MARRQNIAFACTLALCAPPVAAQSFVLNTSQIPSGPPGNASESENVDFADVDLDGDWDAAFADGGNVGTDQNRLWINQGFSQGGSLGTFFDETASRFPAVSDQSRDIEFVDFEGDGDPDVFVSNTSSILNQASLFWVNLGGAQGGSAGFYQDETATRWVGLGGAGSSIFPGLVLGSGGYISWVGDSDFGDLDNDGDLDLVHSAYGGAFGGQVPTRIFLNDGAGFFSELNPNGVQLGGATIPPGTPAMWCDGTQENDTTDVTGVHCDIATTAVDVDLGDVDGDFDLDILLGDRSGKPRLFANRLDPSALAPAQASVFFRDVTGTFPAGYAIGSGAYEQEMGDFEGDGDLDILGVGWGAGPSGYFEHTLAGVGDGFFTDVTVVPGTEPDDEEGDCFDYDNDGDLDFFIANFSGQDRLHRNENNGGPSFSFTNVTASELPSYTGTAHDADACDVDGDGDYDVFVANGSFEPNLFLENVTGVPDTHAPVLPHLEQAPHRLPGPLPTVVRVHVYDNAPYYVTYFNSVFLEVSVNGGAPQIFPMTSSGGQVFRGEIPGSLVGGITYRAVSRDRYGNTGASEVKTYISGICPITSFCSSGPNSTGSPAVMGSSGNCFLGSNALTLTAAPVPNQPGLFFYSSTQVNGGLGAPFGNGLLCVGAPGSQSFRLPVEVATGNVLSHALDVTNPPSLAGLITSGSTWHFQAWFRDPAAGGAFFDLSDGLTVTFQ